MRAPFLFRGNMVRQNMDTFRHLKPISHFHPVTYLALQNGA